MRYLFGSQNLALDAPMTATNVVPSNAVARTDTIAKLGGGQVSLTGDYVGAEDATFDVAVVAGTATARRVSAPVLAGVGNGSMTDLAASNAVAEQSFTITLEDLGTITLAAGVTLAGGRLEARAAGAAGNGITVTINVGGLTYAATQFSLLRDIRAGQTEFFGDEWDWGAVSLEDGLIPAAAPRLRIGNDPQIFRLYKTFQQGGFVYALSPTPPRDIQAGARVRTVTGGRTVTINQTSTTDTLTDVVTWYDLLSKINASSTLVRFIGTVINDRRPLGQGATDVSVYTQSYVASVVRDGSATVRAADFDIHVAAAAPTETLDIVCTDASTANAERWAVRGPVSGTLLSAITGVLYASGAYAFTIPFAPAPVAIAGQNSISATIEPVPRQAGEKLPLLCIKHPALGSLARAKTYVFEWRARVSSCKCDPDDIVGGPRFSWLGISPESSTEDVDMDQIPAPLQARLETLYEWRQEFMAANALLAAANSEINAEDTPDNLDSDATTQSVIADYFDSLRESGTAAGFVRRELVSAVLRVNRVDVAAVNAATLIMRLALTETLAAVLAVDEEGEIDAGALSEWDAAMADLSDQFDLLGGGVTVGADFWRKASTFYTANLGFDELGARLGSDEVAQKLIDSAPQLLTQEFDTYLERFRSRMDYFRVLAGFLPNFDSPTLTDDVWVDHGGAEWFVSLDGLLPLQPNHYYHSARDSGLGEDGEIDPVPTLEFGIGVSIGCGIKIGDRLLVEVDLAGVVRSQYQQGDRISAQVVRQQPLVLAGGQTGNHQQTWTVNGSVAGALDPYELSLTSPAPYSDGGLEFLINQGAIPFALGDQFSVSVSASQFRHRKNGGAWSANIDIDAAVALSDGLTVTFVEGPAPSWVTGDTWSFLAEAVNGVGQLRRPTGGALLWTTSLQLDITVADGIAGVALIDHTIPSDAVIILLASNDAFATAPALSRTVTWADGSIWVPLVTEYTSYRITVDQGGSIFWLWVAESTQLQLVDGAGVANGRALLRRRLPSASVRRGRGVRVRHEWVDHASADHFVAALESACADDDGRFAVLLHDDDPPAFVRLVPGSMIDVPDEQTFYKASARAMRRHAIELELEPVP